MNHLSELCELLPLLLAIKMQIKSETRAWQMIILSTCQLSWMACILHCFLAKNWSKCSLCVDCDSSVSRWWRLHAGKLGQRRFRSFVRVHTYYWVQPARSLALCICTRCLQSVHIYLRICCHYSWLLYPGVLYTSLAAKMSSGAKDKWRLCGAFSIIAAVQFSLWKCTNLVCTSCAVDTYIALGKDQNWFKSTLENPNGIKYP